MHRRPGEQYSRVPAPAGAIGTAPGPPEVGAGVGTADRVAPAARRWWIAAGWIGAGLALFALYLRISLSYPADSDGANSALQGWDMLHGNLVLHGWILGDATYYTFELPLYAITEVFSGLHSATIHLVSAVTYLIVAASAVAVARADSRGLSRVARCGVVIAVLAAPLLAPSGVSVLLELPDHIGTAAILLVCVLLVDRAPAWRFTPLLLCAILVAGQLGDATVRYVAVPAVLVVCAYRVLTTTNLRTVLRIRAGDAAIAVAAAVSVPLAIVARAGLVHLGGYLMIPPHTQIAPIGQWGHNGILALQNILTLFGATHGDVLGTAGGIFGLACLLAAVCGLGKVLLTWRTASRAEQLLCMAIFINITVYVISSIPVRGNAWELAAVLPCGAVLAARACVAGRIVEVRPARTAIVAATVAALLPLAAAASRPPVDSPAVRLAAWLQAHRLTYGIGGYWDASAVTVQSGGQVQVRAVRLIPASGRTLRFAAYDWETKAAWYDSSQHDATFVIADQRRRYGPDGFSVAVYEKYLPRPTASYRVAGHVILVYRTNVLRQVIPALPLNHTAGVPVKHTAD